MVSGASDILSLPETLQKGIISNSGLGLRERFGVLPLVCRSLAGLAEEVLYHTVECGLSTPEQLQSLFHWITRHGQHVRVLRVTLMGQWGDCARSPGFLAWWSLWSSLHVSQLRAPRLEGVCVSEVPELWYSPMPQRYLEVAVASLASIPGLQLQALVLKGRLSRSGLYVLPHISSLSKLSITCSEEVPGQVSVLSALTCLTELFLGGAPPVPELATTLGGMSLLQSLKLDLDESPYDSPVLGLQVGQVLGRLTALTYLKVQEGSSGMLDHVSNLTQLRHLDWQSFCPYVIRSLPGSLQYMAYLDDRLGEHVVAAMDWVANAALLQQLTRLTHLEVSLTGDQPGVVNAAFMAALTSLSSLRSLFLGQYTGRYVGAQISGLSSLQSLTTLGLRCLAFEPPAAPLLHVLSCLTGLHELELKNFSVVDAHVLSITSHLQQLTSLHLKTTATLTADALGTVTRLQHLQRLRLSGPPGHSEEFQASLPPHLRNRRNCYGFA